MRYDERFASRELEELESAFLETAEDDHRPETSTKKERAKTKAARRQAAMALCGQVDHERRGVWRRLAGRLGRLTGRARDLLLCCTHATDGVGLYSDDDSIQEVLSLVDGHADTTQTVQGTPSPRKRTGSLVSDEAITQLLCTSVPPTPRHMNQSTSPFDEAVEDTLDSWSFEPICDELYGEEEEEEEEKCSELQNEAEEDDLFLTPRTLRAKCRFEDAVHQHLETERLEQGDFSVDWERRVICKRFTRVLFALKCVFALNQLVDERKEASSRVIRRAWHSYRRRASVARLTKLGVKSSNSKNDDDLQPEAHGRGKKRLHEMIASDTVGDDEAFHPVLSSGNSNEEYVKHSQPESNLLVSELLQHESLFTVKRRAALPTSLTTFPILVRADEGTGITAEERAVRTIQSFWCHELAKRRDEDLCRLSEYERESQSVMPIIRTQMRMVRQRLDELRRRQHGRQSMEFDDDWL